MKISVVGVREAVDMLRDTAKTEQEALQDILASEIRSRTPIDTGQARRAWRKRSGQVENRVPYIERLENGYSKQAPQGFVQQSIRATVNKRKSK